MKRPVIFHLNASTHVLRSTSYKLGFYTYQTVSASFIGVKINGDAVADVPPTAPGGDARWAYNEYDFTATTGQHLLEFEFYTGQGSVQRIDLITLDPGT